MQARTWREFAWLLVACGTLAFALGRHALIDPDEGRNASIAQEMRVSGDFLVPHLNGLPFLDKPPLYFAAEAAAMRALGSSETAARLPSLLSAWATVALTAWFSGHLFGRRTAWIAATAAATAPLAIAMARTAIFDSMLAFFVALAMCAFYRAVESESARPSSPRWRPWTLLGWTAIALGVLTKGPVALLVPLLVAGSYALWRRRSLAVWHPSGWLLFLGLVLPWALYVEHRIPGFLRYALLTESWGRLTSSELKRTGPIWYFLPYLLAGFFPWIVVVAVAARRRWRESVAPAGQPDAAGLPTRAPSAAAPSSPRHALVFLALWIALPMLLFSISQSKRPQYILPLLPAVAMLATWVWSGPAPPWRGVRAAAAGWILLGGTFLVAPYTRPWLELHGELARAGRGPVLVIGSVALVCGLLAWWHSRRSGLTPVLLTLPVIALVLVTPPALAELARSRSAKELANAIRPHLTAATRVIQIDTFSPSLGFYIGRPTQLSTETPALMDSNFITRFADRLAAPATPLLPAGSWRQALADCVAPTVFVFRERQLGERSVFAAAGLAVLFERRNLVAMGPCTERPGGPTPPIPPMLPMPNNAPPGAPSKPGAA